MINSKTILIACLVSAAFASSGFFIGHHYSNIKWSLKWEERNLDDSNARTEAEKQERAKEQAWADAIAQIGEKAHESIEETRKRERAAADNRMRKYAEDYARRASKETCASGGGAPEGIEVLAQLFADADELAERVAAEADESRVRGLACEAAYDAL